jgi:hypothetical protein
MDWTDIHGYDRNTHFFALALCKIQFEEVWYHKITNNLKIEKQKTRQNGEAVAIQIASGNYPKSLL